MSTWPPAAVTSAAATRAPVGLFPSTGAASGNPDLAAQAAMAHEEGLAVFSNEEVAAMPADIRIEYLQALHRFQMAKGITNGFYQSWRRFEASCPTVLDEVTGERCGRPRWESSPRCLKCSSVDEIDPNGAEERRRAAARARAAAMTEAALDELEKILLAPDTEIGPSVRMKAIESVLDRGGLPKRSESKQEVSGEVTHTVDTRQLIEDRLDRMGESMLSRELAGIEEASVIEVEPAEFEEDVDDGA